MLFCERICRRGHVGCSAGFLILLVYTVSASTLEVYDDVSVVDMDEEGNYVDKPLKLEQATDPRSNKDPLFNLIRTLQIRDTLRRLQDRPIWYDVNAGNSNAIQSASDLHSLKDGVVKRLADQLHGTKNYLEPVTPRSVKPQRKWKTKKGRTIGSQMVCYFKLCAFRSPA